MRNLLSLETLAAADIERIVAMGRALKSGRGSGEAMPLLGQCWAMIFAKASTRTRVSFEVGIRELGGAPVFLNAAELQLGRGEPIEDTARVLGRMMHGAIIRTFAQKDVETFAAASELPTINALTDEEHPCQILADLLTIEEVFGAVAGRRVCFIGDGACNVARSWMWAAGKCGFHLAIVAPPGFQPSADLVRRAGNTIVSEDLAAADGAEVLYTDVWVSMGREEESRERLERLAPYQVNETLVRRAAPNAVVMHCLPAYRGKEITAETFDRFAGTIFDQTENRLHAQKAVLSLLADAHR